MDWYISAVPDWTPDRLATVFVVGSPDRLVGWVGYSASNGRFMFQPSNLALLDEETEVVIRAWVARLSRGCGGKTEQVQNCKTEPVHNFADDAAVYPVCGQANAAYGTSHDCDVTCERCLRVLHSRES